MTRPPRFNPEGVKVLLVYCVIAGAVGGLVGLAFGLISPLAGWIVGGVCGGLALLLLCICYTAYA